ncbi:MAG: B12-binding domain-containing protein, partial [bacterium]|nr:B12-binding domain-containing protein [bacterium]
MPEQVALIQRQFLAQYLAAESCSIARMAAGRLVADNPELAARFAPHPEIKWQSHLEGWTTDLSAAVNVGLPEVFASRLCWCVVAFRARGVPLCDLNAAFEAFRRTLSRHVPAEDVPALSPFLEAAFARLQGTGPEVETAQTKLPRLATAFLVAVLEGERTRAANLIIDAVRSGAIQAREVSPVIFAPVMAEVGRLWHLDELSVAEEHFATSTVLTVQAQLQLFVTPKARNGLTLLAAGVEG